MMQLINLFKLQRWKITFACSASDSEFSFDIVAAGIDKVTIELNKESFDHFVKELQPSIVLFDRFMTEEQFGWRVAEQCPGALRIIDTEDLHCLRYARQQAFKEKREFVLSDLNNEHAKREIASILRSDLSLIISEYEMSILQHYFKVDENLLHYVPFMLESQTETKLQTLPTFEERTHFISIGNFLHEPNWNSVLYLKQEIWPLIRKELPQAELYVYGAYPSQKVLELNQPKDGFIIKGRANEVKTVMSNARVCLAPLRFGAGIKGKLIDAMQYGTPSVTTSIGAESMHGSFEWNGIIANNAHQFAEAAVTLYNSKDLWLKSQLNGITIINNNYNSQKHGAALLDKLLSTQLNLEAHRATNFMGSLLMHHTLSSTKYMSRWIEEKNKRMAD